MSLQKSQGGQVGGREGRKLEEECRLKEKRVLVISGFMRGCLITKSKINITNSANENRSKRCRLDAQQLFL